MSHRESVESYLKSMPPAKFVYIYNWYLRLKGHKAELQRMKEIDDLFDGTSVLYLISLFTEGVRWRFSLSDDWFIYSEGNSTIESAERDPRDLHLEFDGLIVSITEDGVTYGDKRLEEIIGS